VTESVPLRWGIIGTGGIAAAFTEDLKRTKSGEAVAVGSRTQASADVFGDKHGVQNRHSSYEALVEDSKVDVVYVATPHPMHHANARLALDAGKPVLVEKAFTMNVREAQDLVDTARAKGLFLMEAMWTRFLPHIAEIRRLVTGGDLGEITTLIADHGKTFEKDPTSRLFAPELGGGAVLDLGVYPISFASLILGRPETIRALSTAAFTGVDAQTSILLGHAGGAQALLTCSTSTSTPTRALIAGTEARIEVDSVFFAPTAFTVVPRDGSQPVRYLPQHEGRLRYEADEVARCIRAGLIESPLMPLDETVSIVATMEEVLRQSAGATGAS
jgi:predicted dehydrogenase